MPTKPSKIKSRQVGRSFPFADEQSIRVSVIASTPEHQRPEAARRLAAIVDRHRTLDREGRGVESVDDAVAEGEIADQQIAAELTPVAGASARLHGEASWSATNELLSSVPSSLKTANAP